VQSFVASQKAGIESRPLRSQCTYRESPTLKRILSKSFPFAFVCISLLFSWKLRLVRSCLEGNEGEEGGSGGGRAGLGGVGWGGVEGGGGGHASLH
jgi:uncharacterized membrane protein YgcG